jgi:hypothetical protein
MATLSESVCQNLNEKTRKYSQGVIFLKKCRNLVRRIYKTGKQYKACYKQIVKTINSVHEPFDHIKI